MSTWFETYRGVVHPWMCDQFGHLNVRFYAHIFDDSGFALWPMVGVGRLAFERAGAHTVVARTETDFRAELPPGRFIVVRSRFERVGSKSVGYVQELRDADTDQLHAEQRVVEVFFDPRTRASCPMPDAIREALERTVGTSETDDMR
ncbi:acyl-CoA thioesterase [Paraliomyxa miuraensis]|uniref:acyl-CoA thioesterase n=1 Tax=Paraliomyxa miuraensis TaxID=376150 RepID=UPI0022544133|nr:thioesterase family protein [Paraliomyxa miuraensis]MCX4241944.1 acyl-CoA thioesterase [Paraliomyxa miuraensis]